MEPDDAEVWPDTDLSVSLFGQISTQWRMGMNGPVGLDYGVLEFVLKLRRVPRSQWPRVFDDVRLMEHAAMQEITGS
ncbi:DUF1799 domain-containing protein [Cupriavidus respiraculi]|uniref:Uncharacterized protein n=2 Tax=Cupriavidus respiraculi TaxID=195930 RepID=A0ABM8XV64_9BURK|nr:hypothetical protein LMG21510_05060 [Cupriavidus respiraculi]